MRRCLHSAFIMDCGRAKTWLSASILNTQSLTGQNHFATPHSLKSEGPIADKLLKAHRTGIHECITDCTDCCNLAQWCPLDGVLVPQTRGDRDGSLAERLPGRGGLPDGPGVCSVGGLIKRLCLQAAYRFAGLCAQSTMPDSKGKLAVIQYGGGMVLADNIDEPTQVGESWGWGGGRTTCLAALIMLPSLPAWLCVSIKLATKPS